MNNNRPHGIMFHHFHDDNKHIVGQGSIDSQSFSDLLDFYSQDHNLIGAHEFMEKLLSNNLSEKDVCITFDDGLLCQYDIAFPVLKQRNLTAFWFIYTSPINGVLEKLEIYRHFRFSKFKDIDSFYQSFFDIVSKNIDDLDNKMKDFDAQEYLKDFSFYTYNDRYFRYLRDVVLGMEKYYALMDKMIEESDYDINENARLLWITKQGITDLHDNGHIIGLHSHSHPTMMINNSKSRQLEEYTTNKTQLENIINEKIISVSYPSNSYNIDTLDCMNQLGIKIGFRANMADICLRNPELEIPREDHANILKAMKENQ